MSVERGAWSTELRSLATRLSLYVRVLFDIPNSQLNAKGKKKSLMILVLDKVSLHELRITNIVIRDSSTVGGCETPSLNELQS